MSSASAHPHPQSPVRSHREIGERLDLLHFPEHAPGQACWHQHGLVLYRLIEDLVRDRYRDGGYQEVRSPLACDRSLWERSGHWQKFSDKMVSFCCQDRDGALKPMNCPGHIDIYAQRPRSHRELPLRIAELGHVHRAERSGELNGLLRARSFVQDDAHIFCAPDQVQAEVAACLEQALSVYALFGLEVRAELSLRPDKRLGDDALWDRAEGDLRAALAGSGIAFCEQPGEGAFYGPKIDLHVSDRLGRSWQMGSVQLDYQLPERFDLSYINAENSDRDSAGRACRPVMVHRALLGSLERFIGILLESDDGWLPAWCSPRQAAVLPVSAAQREDAQRALEELEALGVRAELIADGPLGGRIRDAALARIPAVCVIGAREAESGLLAVRLRDGSHQQLSAGELSRLVRQRAVSGAGQAR